MERGSEIVRRVISARSEWGLAESLRGARSSQPRPDQTCLRFESGGGGVSFVYDDLLKVAKTRLALVTGRPRG